MVMELSAVAADKVVSLPINDGDDLAALRSENQTLRTQLKTLRRYVTELEHTADMDPLVPTYNRRAFIRELTRAQSVFARYGIPCSVIFLDLNDFKKINDRFGHSVGDELLRRVGEALVCTVRQCDMVARLGGDEFGVLMFKAGIDQAREKGNAMARHIEAVRVPVPTASVRTTASWGVAACDGDADPEQILSMADEAMYASKADRKRYVNSIPGLRA